ncbi:MAG TPA: hypothetical protein PLH19_09220 [Anaerolineae bacterium]|nr:hypothetical protein [Anaerolineae bacterium]HQH38697.1 hypothetical protein [Anaerolineae bacterium]
MRRTKLLRYSIILSVLIVLAGVGQGWAAPLFQNAVWIITSPGEGSILSGVVTIQGTATHPNFVSYAVLYAPGDRVTGATVWDEKNPIAWNVTTMVVNGTLATWDTTRLPNGKYVLALAMWNSGSGTPDVYFINNLTIQNEPPTPTTEPTPEPTPTEIGVAPTAEGAVPIAPTIEQPPTATPRPTATLGPNVTPGAGAGDGGDKPQINISLDSVKETFLTGVKLAVMLYVLGGVYVAAKAAVRYFLRIQRRKPRS